MSEKMGSCICRPETQKGYYDSGCPIHDEYAFRQLVLSLLSVNKTDLQSQLAATQEETRQLKTHLRLRDAELTSTQQIMMDYKAEVLRLEGLLEEIESFHSDTGYVSSAYERGQRNGMNRAAAIAARRHQK